MSDSCDSEPEFSGFDELDILSFGKKRLLQDVAREVNCATPASKKQVIDGGSGRRKKSSISGCLRTPPTGPASSTKHFYGKKSCSQEKTPNRHSGDTRLAPKSFDLEDGDLQLNSSSEEFCDEDVEAFQVSPPISTPVNKKSDNSSTLKEIANLIMKRMDDMEDQLTERIANMDEEFKERIDHIDEEFSGRIDHTEGELKQFSSENAGKQKAVKTKTSVPLIVKLRKTYKALLEKEDNDFEGFDYSPDAPFDGPANEAVVSQLVKEVTGNNKQFQASQVRLAARTYYRSKSQEESGFMSSATL